MILVAVGTGDLAGLDLAEPGDVLVLRVTLHRGWFEQTKQRVFFASLGFQRLFVADADAIHFGTGGRSRSLGSSPSGPSLRTRACRWAS